MDTDTALLSENKPDDATSVDMSSVGSPAVTDLSSTTSTTTATTPFEWGTSDATSLAPTNVAIAKAQRAWERRPQSPFSRRRFKVGKIFKRSNNAAPSSAFVGPFDVHIRAPTSTGHGTPLKAVKKLRVASDAPGGFGSIVSTWETRGSPASRRIVTRAGLNRSEGEQLTALADEDEGEEDMQAEDEDVGEDDVVGGTTVEILNEDGTARNDPSESLNSDEWEDESATEADDEEEIERLVDIARTRDRGEEEQAQTEACEMAIAGLKIPRYPGPRPLERTDTSPNASDAHRATVDAAGEESSPSHREAPTNATEQARAAPPQIPDGFVSPAVVRRRPIDRVRHHNANKRQTLPMNFAAHPKAAKPTTDTTTSQKRSNEIENTQEHSILPTVEEEDIQRGLARTDFVPREQTPDRKVAVSPPVTDSTEQSLQERQGQDGSSPARLTDSPVPSISGSHPRLPLRRSPRRQSTSPMKRKSILKAPGKSHLIAFTPIKLPAKPTLDMKKAQLASSPLPVPFSTIGAVEDSNIWVVPRSSSAPPESPQMSPRRPYQPRISDDTALLEAFLKRASENRTGKSLSDTARRESLERLQESDVVPQALASSPLLKQEPAEIYVLAQMDPNSPYPRKQLADQSFGAAVPSEEAERRQDPIQDDEDELATETVHPKRFASRKSGRTKRRPDSLSASSSNAGPRQIAIKGSADGVVLKKTEAQELAQQTRKNTRDNKQGAVLPPQRLKGLAIEQESLGEIMEVEHPPGRRGITWSETLVSYQEKGEEPEVSTMMDELSAESEQSHTGVNNGEDITVPPASETPSKPRQRRLKIPKQTASSNAKAPDVEFPSAKLGHLDAAPDVAAMPPTKATNKRKIPRIATPGKALNTSTILDQLGNADFTSKPEAEPDLKMATIASSSRKTTAVPTMRKGAAPSKLPAPATAPGLATGKENSLIASPPKKRTTKTSAIAAAGPTKGLSSVPKFDLGKAASQSAEKEAQPPPGLLSPAKKAPRSMHSMSRTGSGRQGGEELVNVMSSPAKKRSRKIFGEVGASR